MRRIPGQHIPPATRRFIGMGLLLGTSQPAKCSTRRSRKRWGASVVELAFVMPVFVMISLGIIEFGRAMMVSQVVTNAAREGARLAVVTGTTNDDVEEAVRDFLEAALNIDPDDATITITVTPAAGNPSAGNEVGTAKSRDLCNVSVEVPFNKVNYIASTYLEGKTLKGYCAMRHE